MPVTAVGTAALQFALEVLHTSPVLLHNLLDMGNAVKVDFELIQLSQQSRISRNLLVRAVNDISRPVVLHLCEHLCLLAEVLNVVFDVGHQLVKVMAQRGERGAVEQEKPLAAGPARRPGTAGASIQSSLSLSQ